MPQLAARGCGERSPQEARGAGRLKAVSCFMGVQRVVARTCHTNVAALGAVALFDSRARRWFLHCAYGDPVACVRRKHGLHAWGFGGPVPQTNTGNTLRGSLLDAWRYGAKKMGKKHSDFLEARTLKNHIRNPINKENNIHP